MARADGCILFNADLKLGHSNRKLAEFAGRVSHDLRIPLTTILGYVELSEDDADVLPDSPAAGYLQRIGGSGLRMLGMLDDVLRYSRVGGTLRRQSVSLQGAGAEAVSDLGDGFGCCAALESADAELLGLPTCVRIVKSHGGRTRNHGNPRRRNDGFSFLPERRPG
ncbi:histidine kinase dimerization/phospho-acceptor domain-containing protein [Arthrobacter sp. 24S4-2]|uniref:histidine kinase dimerization/phospho-acceptor domain-containing protein n=1 Tax=Arthrobacter sp. 24S4-2 TaxID=2575374 RepID=UPI0020C79BBF|nr:histidine kinase dimerization/phospho-acceptor domain-containing protein [Arthrobacter sp. 24S4-2]